MRLEAAAPRRTLRPAFSEPVTVPNLVSNSSDSTIPVQERHRFDSAALEAWLSKNVDGFRGPLTVEQFKGGQSNPTYRLTAASARYVMRSKPGPAAKLLPSAHAVDREHRIMTALQLALDFLQPLLQLGRPLLVVRP